MQGKATTYMTRLRQSRSSGLQSLAERCSEYAGEFSLAREFEPLTSN